jgi:hypothetical protein
LKALRLKIGCLKQELHEAISFLVNYYCPLVKMKSPAFRLVISAHHFNGHKRIIIMPHNNQLSCALFWVCSWKLLEKFLEISYTMSIATSSSSWAHRQIFASFSCGYMATWLSYIKCKVSESDIWHVQACIMRISCLLFLSFYSSTHLT